MAAPRSFSIDPSGTWSWIQVQKVLEILEPEAAAMGLQLHAIDVSTFNTPKRFMISVLCKKHNFVIPVNHACKFCLEENPCTITKPH